MTAAPSLVRRLATGPFKATALRWWLLASMLALLVVTTACITKHPSAGAAPAGVNAGGGQRGAGTASSGSQSVPILVLLVLNVATLVSAATAAYAAFKITPRTTLTVADKQADVARAAVDVAARSADASFQSASASLLNAQAATRTSENLGIHAIARLRQEWINELRGRVAQAHALLSNWRPPAPGETAEEKQGRDKRAIEANEVIARIELLLNPKEDTSKRLLKAIDSLNAASGDTSLQRELGRPVIVAAQKVLKQEWDRVRAELKGEEFGPDEPDDPAACI